MAAGLTQLLRVTMRGIFEVVFIGVIESSCQTLFLVILNYIFYIPSSEEEVTGNHSTNHERGGIP